MRDSLVIFRRELKSYFYSPIAYVFGVLFLGVLLYIAAKGSLVAGMQASMQGFFGLLPLLLLIFVPPLTMRSWAEERKTGTIELLMTYPAHTGSLVAGKYLASVAYLGFVLVLTLGLPLTLGAYGRLDWPPVVGAYLASLLFAGSFVAVGMFFSSLTRDQIVAMLVSLFVLAVLYLLGHPLLAGLFLEWLPTWGVDLVHGLSPYKYFESIARGALDTRDLVYFACFQGFFLYANALVLHHRRTKG
ncbi:MAG: ABC transporter permease subunit [Planctomycetes bacterium]|nr:ABC transporter permease subunit [Planctomycetota bacterium]